MMRSTLALKFTGKERDSETGLDYFGARYLSSAQGRFTSADSPFADQYAADPQSWNAYAYVRNNPLRNTDPTGNACLFNRAQTQCATSLSEAWSGFKTEVRNTAIAANDSFTALFNGISRLSGSDVRIESTAAPEPLTEREETAVNVISFAVAGLAPEAKAGAVIEGVANDVRNFRVQSQAQGVHDALGVGTIAYEMRTSAVAEVKAANGGVVTMVASSEATLTRAQRSAMPAGAIPVKGVRGVHAEMKIRAEAKKIGGRVQNVGTAPRNPCPDCQQTLSTDGTSNPRPLQ